MDFSPSTRAVVVAPALVAAALVVSGCFESLTVDKKAQILCDSNADCPANTTCAIEAHRCVLPGVVLDTTAPLVTAATTSAPRIGAAQTANVAVTLSEPIAAATVRIEGDDADLAADVVDVSDAVVTVTVRGADRPASGAVALLVDATDLAGNTGALRVAPGLVVDIDPPAVVADTVDVRTSQDNVLFPGGAAAARADSTVDVTIAFSEAVAAVTGLTLTDAAGAHDVSAAISVTDNRASFTLTAADLAGLADGDVTLGVNATDDVDNSATGDLTSTLAIDNARPAPPVLRLLRRAPFGDTSATPVTHAEGVAADAVVVIAIPSSVTVDPQTIPQNVARVTPQAADASFTIDLNVDVPALRVVAVDEAGNLSEPATAQETDLVASVQQEASPHELVARPVAATHLVQGGDERIDRTLRDDGAVSSSARPFWRALTGAASLPAPPLFARDPIGGGVLAVAGGQTFRLFGPSVVSIDAPVPLRRGAAMALDEHRGRVVLFGGEDGAGVEKNDVLEFDGAAWRAIDVAGPRPPARLGHAMIYSAAEGGVVVVGGCAELDPTFFGCKTPRPVDAWVFDGTSFTELCSGGCGDVDLNPLSLSLTVDGAGRVVAFGGTNDSGFALVGPDPLPPQLHTLDGGAFVGSCGGTCAEDLPVLGGVATFDPVARLPAFVGTCRNTHAGLCRTTVDGETAHATSLAGAAAFPALGGQGSSFQGYATAVDLDGAPAPQLFVASSATVFAAGDVGFAQVLPSSLAPRCAGAVAEVDGALALLGGCSRCEAREPQQLCGAVQDLRETPDSLFAGATSSPVAGPTIAAPFSSGAAGDAVLLTQTFAGDGSGVAELRRASALADPPVGIALDEPGCDNPPFSSCGGFLVAAWSPQQDGNVVLVRGLADNVAFPPVRGIRTPVFLVDASGAVTDGCSGNCLLSFSSGTGVAAAASPGGAGVLFGGSTAPSDFGGGDPVAGTSLVDDTGQGALLSNLATEPNARRFAGAAYDPELDVTWLFGGAVSSEGSPGFATCGPPGSPQECGDLWQFDGAAWTAVSPADLDGVGGPPPRMLAQVGSDGGGLLVTGGVVGAVAATTLTDGWRLSASSTTPPSHELIASFAPYGDDATQALSGVEAHWCGAAADATGADVDVVLRAWVGGGWRDLSSTRDGACVDGVLDTTGVLDVILRPGISVVVEVLPLFTARGSGRATLTTTAFTTTARFTPPSSSP